MFCEYFQHEGVVVRESVVCSKREQVVHETYADVAKGDFVVHGPRAVIRHA